MAPPKKRPRPRLGKAPSAAQEPNAGGRMELVPGAPLFHQLAQALRAEIRSGKRAKGEYLPNEAALEKAYGVSRVTVRRALAELKAEGLIESRRRAGTRVTGKGAASRSRLIGVLTPNMFQAQYASFLHALEGALRPQGLDLIVHNSELSPEVERAGLEAHLARGVEAILHIWDKKSAANLPLLKRIAAAGIPLLVVDHREAGLDADFIVQDHRLGMKLALEYLVARGARKLLHVRAVVGLWGADEREAGFREEARRQGVPTGDLTTLVGDYDGETARASLARHYRPGVPFPTGIVASADMTAQAAHDFFHERGARIPGELHLVAFGTDPGALRSREAIQCIDSMAAVQARAAAARLLERLGGDGARRVVVTPMALAPGGRG